METNFVEKQLSQSSKEIEELRFRYMQGFIDYEKYLHQSMVIFQSQKELKKSIVDDKNRRQLNEIAYQISQCNKCGLCNSGLSVPGEGNPNAKIVIIAEAPGQHESEQGKPFVGRAGKRLNAALHHCEIKRDNVFITNILKHRPPNNRNPHYEEIKKCGIYLYKQINIIKPQVIVTLGSFATKFILDTNKPISLTRGQLNHVTINGHESYVLPTYHPSATLYDNSKKGVFFEDIEFVNELII
jgi:DNA polymerase